MDNQLRKLTNGFIYFEMIKEKKTICGPIYDDSSKNWSFEKAETEMDMAKYSGANVIGPVRILKLKKSGIVCIDIDDKNATYDQIIEAYPCLNGQCYVKGNTKGFHFYVKSQGPSSDKIKVLKHFEGDIIVIQMFEAEGKKWTNDIQDFDLSQVYEEDAETDTEIDSIDSISSSKLIKLDSYYRDILNNIDPKEYTPYDKWMKFIGAIKNSFDNAIDIADAYSKLINGYVSKQDVEKHMTYDNISIGYLVNLSKKSNIDTHKKIVMERRKLPAVMNEYELASIAIELCDDIIKIGDALYVYECPYWVLDITKRQDKVSKKVLGVLRPFFIDYLKKVSDALQACDEDSPQKPSLESKMKQLCGITIALGKINDVHNIVSMIRIQMADCTTDFDMNPYLFCFKNCAFDLQTGRKVIIKKDDYVLQHTGTDYVPPTAPQIELMRTLLQQIHPDPEIFKSYMSILFMGMTGIRVEKFFLANGCGRNGKGLINEIFMALLGSYGYILPVDILTSKKEVSSGANPQIANCHKKRFILSREPEEGSKLRTSTIKEMTGGCEINARQLYSGDCKVVLQQVMMLECNEKPQLSGTMNEAILERIIDIPFNSYFTSDESLINESEHIYPVNIDYKLSSFQDEHRSALFHILLESSKEIYIPKCITSRSKEYVMSSDEIYTWVAENFDNGSNDDIITAKDLYALYCEGDVYMNMTKEEKRIMNKKKFSLLLKSSIAFKGKYKDDRRDIKGKSYYERLHGYKLKLVEKEPDLI